MRPRALFPLSSQLVVQLAGAKHQASHLCDTSQRVSKLQDGHLLRILGNLWITLGNKSTEPGSGTHLAQGTDALPQAKQVLG